jgi:hypothetical protein
VSEFCEQTRCDVERDECWEDVDDCESTCLSGSIEIFESCYAVCHGMDCPVCGSDDDECAVSGYRFEVSGAPDRNIEGACQRAAARDLRCSEQTVDARCEHFARVETARAVAAYVCIAALDCGASIDVCLDALPTSDFGQRFCAGLQETCSSSQCDAASIDELGRWLRPEVTAAALDCFDNASCANIDACLEAWWDAVYPLR